MTLDIVRKWLCLGWTSNYLVYKNTIKDMSN